MQARLSIRGLFQAWCAATVPLSAAIAQEKKPNILVIVGDDIGTTNVSA